jgi:hypothetical protein
MRMSLPAGTRPIQDKRRMRRTYDASDRSLRTRVVRNSRAQLLPVPERGSPSGRAAGGGAAAWAWNTGPPE